MTRINVVPVQELTDKHLVAEYREIMRLPNNLIKSINRKSKPFTLNEIPAQYTMGKGHVKFFYNKMLYLERRFKELVNEMDKRKFRANYRDSSIFTRCANIYKNDWTPNEKDATVNRDRIRERLLK